MDSYYWLIKLYYAGICIYSYFIPGGWSDDGLSVEAVDDQTIKCSSKHLTSFAVLVDVSGSHEVLAYILHI